MNYKEKVAEQIKQTVDGAISPMVERLVALAQELTVQSFKNGVAVGKKEGGSGGKPEDKTGESRKDAGAAEGD